jgi:hypothetical protein
MLNDSSGDEFKNINTSEKDSEIVIIMSKLLDIPQEEILGSIKLFSNINPNLINCFSKLARMEEKDYVNAFMLLEYLLFSSDAALKIIDDPNFT